MELTGPGSPRHRLASTATTEHPREPESILRKPKLAVYDGRYTRALEHLAQFKKHLNEARVQLQAKGFQHHEIDSLLNAIVASMHAVLQPRPEVLVSCLGNTGDGKTATMNSAICMRNVVTESDSARRGTSVPTEIAGLVPAASQNLFASVVGVCRSDEEVWDMVVSGCRAVFGFFNDDEEDEEDEEEDESDDDDEEGGGQQELSMSDSGTLAVQRAQQNEADAFMDVVCTLLRNRTGFYTREAVQKYFESRRADPEDEVVQSIFR